jgi:hypothetical protein
MRNAVIKGGKAHAAHILKIRTVTEIVPKPQRDRRQLQPALSASAIFGHTVAAFLCNVFHKKLLFLSL